MSNVLKGIMVIDYLLHCSFQGKLPISGMAVSKLEDTDNYTNAFEITSK